MQPKAARGNVAPSGRTVVHATNSTVRNVLFWPPRFAQTVVSFRTPSRQIGSELLDSRLEGLFNEIAEKKELSSPAVCSYRFVKGCSAGSVWWFGSQTILFLMS